MKLILENWQKYLTEAKVYTPEEARAGGFLPSMPDHVFNDMKREGFGSFLEDRADDIEEQGLEKILTTDEFGRGWYDRYNLNWTQEPQILDVSWEDIDAEVREFLMNKHRGNNPNFPNQQARYTDIMQRFPGLGTTGDHEPVIVKMEDGKKIVEIIGGKHRTFVAFLKNNFKPIKLNAYVGTAK